jgi:hypothetical protein
VSGKGDQKYQITIRNWDQYQREMRGGENRRRRRSWIAISVDLFSDPDFFKMDLCHRSAWVGLLCHAGKVGAVFELCASDARVMFQLRSNPDFEVFKNQGFIDLKAATDKTDSTNKTNKTDKPSSTAKPSKVVAKEPEFFDFFWAMYPKKVGKKNAKKKWIAMKLDSKADEIMADIRFRLDADVNWSRGFIKDPTTYLNGEFWDDETIQTREAGGKPSTDEKWADAARQVDDENRESQNGTTN